EEVGERRVLRQVEGEAFEGQIEGVAVVVGDGVDLAAAAVLEDEAFEEVVDVGQGEVEVDAGVAVDEALALEGGDAAAEEHDVGDRQFGGAGAWLGEGRQRGDGQGQEGGHGGKAGVHGLGLRGDREGAGERLFCCYKTNQQAGGFFLAVECPWPAVRPGRGHSVYEFPPALLSYDRRPRRAAWRRCRRPRRG